MNNSGETSNFTGEFEPASSTSVKEKVIETESTAQEEAKEDVVEEGGGGKDGRQLEKGGGRQLRHERRTNQVCAGAFLGGCVLRARAPHRNTPARHTILSIPPVSR